MRHTRRFIAWVAVAALTAFLTGCEEKDVAGVFGSSNIRASKAETVVFDAADPVMLDIDSSHGDVTVRGADGVQSVSVTLTLRSRGDTLQEARDRVERILYHTERTPEGIVLRYRANEQDADVRRYSGVDFDLVTPVEARVEIDTSNGAISVQAIDGTLRLATSNGAIELVDSGGSADVSTSNGRIEVLRFDGELTLDTSNGELWLDEVRGRIDAETSNGSVHYAGTPSDGRHRIRTSNGSVTLRVPPTASIAFEAITSSGHIRSTLPLIGDTQGDAWSAALHPPAAATFHVHTSNGTIRLEGFRP